MSEVSSDAVAFETPAERESFFDAIARNRRDALRLDVLSGACALALAFVVGLLMAPLCYAVIGVLLDLVNKLLPTPDLIGSATTAVGEMIDHPETITVSQAARFALVAALPGMVMMGLVMRTLGRIMRAAMLGDAGSFGARAPDPGVLAEQRFANVVAEMATAAAIPVPRVLVADVDAVNAAVFGANRANASVIATTGLLKLDNRAELQGVAAHLVGSIASGDIASGARVATILSTFGLIARLSDAFADRGAAAWLAQLLRRALWPVGRTAADDGALAMVLTNPFEPDAPKAAPDDPNKVPWRTFAWMPLVGPLVISGFFGGVLCAFVLGPLLALAWRRRVYLADATAVRLTRDPDTLAGALQHMGGAPVEGAFGHWIAHLSLVPSGLIGAKSIFGGSSVPMAPSLERRLKALVVLGAHVAPRASRQRMPLWAWVLLAPIGVLFVLLMGSAVVGLAYVSAALSGLFTWLPAVVIHAVLR